MGEPSGSRQLSLPAVSDPAATDGHDNRDQPGGGLHHQAWHVHDRLKDGHLESEVMPLDESVSVMRALHATRVQIGLRYP
ncbi:hypothetical protein I6A84_26995 [Frankia sp. CNm7]|uniref:Uncharacterized protein n=1 Tax=Frankia nepalensis TaxID=1836974 RepID=A0A937REP1_9ACTN|nr:hypothetical protein [Frankia nepalensis]MBL7496340.1 hypothetical protein [Frankia nepalensis]MBL7508463.1 hypothetical protein [Frankia nepalensis]MBL7521627.1 hypothetical protein [Frankia nepalensis]MBL7627595.1 hypothetical protein [Frankia nepalensis]